MPDEDKDEFVSRCMGSDGMMAEFPDKSQRAAVCLGAWRKKKKSASNANSNLRRTQLATLEIQKDLIRSEKLDGRTFTVAPCVPIREGVHNNEFISFDEISIFPEAWDGRPLPIDHPTDDDGKAITANSPKVMESSVVGFLFNVVEREDIRGISGEIWVDVEKAGTVPGGAEVLRKLNAGEQLEVSTAYYTFVDKVPGEWKNSDGTIEKFNGSQTGVRPDHLALLPFNTGACNWADGCGAPRNNVAKPNDQTIKSVEDIMPDKQFQVNGKQLGKVLAGVLAAHADGDGSATSMINRLAIAANIEPAKVQALVNGELDFAPRSWLNIFSVILDIDSWDIFMAASSDNADARHKENVKENISSDVSIADNGKQKLATEVGVDTEKKACTPCAERDASEKSLAAKVQEVVTNSITNTIKSLGLRWNSGEQILMDKKQRVDALIASDKTRFAENHREWLMAMNDEQLALFEPEAEKETKSEVQADVTVQVAATEKIVAPEPVAMTKEQMFQTMGLSEEDVKIIKAAADQKKQARNDKIAAIVAASGCPYEKAELEAFSDAMLEKTLNMLQPDGTPFRAAACATRTDPKNAVPAPPAILLAKPEPVVTLLERRGRK